MGLSTTTTIFLFVVCLCGGIIIGAMFGKAGKTPQGTPDRLKEVSQAPAAPGEGLAVPGDTEVLRAWRDKADRLWLEMDGARLENKADLQLEQKKKLANMVSDLDPWLDVPPAAALAPQVLPPLPPPQPVHRPSIFSLRPPKTATPGTDGDEKPKVNLKSIVEQIDDVLQEKLAGTAFSGQKIHLVEGAGGEVMVKIDAEKYAGVEAVPSAEIKALIRQAVTEWEKGSK